VGFEVAGAGDTVGKRLAIGRRISEYISKSHNARVRYNAYDCFIKLIETNRNDFSSVWKHRMNVPRKKREGEEFLNALRTQVMPERNGAGSLAVKLLVLLEEIDDQRPGMMMPEKSWRIR